MAVAVLVQLCVVPLAVMLEGFLRPTGGDSLVFLVELAEIETMQPSELKQDKVYSMETLYR